LKHLKCHKNSVWLKDINPAQELTPNVTSVNSAKHSDSDTETVCYLKRISMYITWLIKISQVALYTVELRNTQHRRNVLAVLTLGILWRISERVVTKLITSHRWFVSALCLSIDLTGRTYCSLGSIQYSSINEQLHYSNSGKIICVFFLESRIERIAVVVTVVTSEILNSEPDKSSSHSNLDSSKISFVSDRPDIAIE